MTQVLSFEDLEKLWLGNTDSSINKAEIITLYWYHRLQCAPIVMLYRLPSRRILPKEILEVKKIPICAICAFATIHRRYWRNKYNKNRGIRDKTYTDPSSGTSCDHIVSVQPGLIPQALGTRFWGSVLYADHYSDFLYNHLIFGTSSLETLPSKHAYKGGPHHME